MWRNKEAEGLDQWLRDRNAGVSAHERAGFYGLDLYSMGTSLRALIEYLERVDPKKVEVAMRRYSCLEPWAEQPQESGRAALHGEVESCEVEMFKMLRDFLAKRLHYPKLNDDGKISIVLSRTQRGWQTLKHAIKQCITRDQTRTICEMHTCSIH